VHSRGHQWQCLHHWLHDSTNFPAKNSLQPTKSGNFNAFVVKLDSAGSILNSTLFGGAVGEFGSSIAVDSRETSMLRGLPRRRIFR